MNKKIVINEIAITAENIVDVMNKNNVYCIVPSSWSDEKYTIKPFGDVEIKKFLSGEVPVIEIVNE